MSTAAISVIVPVYGVEAFLLPCVDSILAQTFADFELILVDDGSPDRCGELCDACALRDSRIRVIHRPNGGLSAARNTGIEAANGQYLAFVDSDDVIAPDYLEQLYTALQNTGADMAVCAVEDVQEDLTPQDPRDFTLPVQSGAFSGQELLHCFYSDCSPYYTVAWNKLYKAELWQNLRYPEGLIHEDDAVAHRLYWQCETVVCLDAPLYSYRLRQGSICRTGITPARFDSISALVDRYRFFASKGASKALRDKALAAAWMRWLGLCGQMNQEETISEPLLERWNAAREQMQDLVPYLQSCGSLSLVQKFSCRRWSKPSANKRLKGMANS